MSAGATMMRTLLLLGLLGASDGQLVGTMNVEMPPPVAISRCTKDGGCVLEEASATLDGNWRWTHSVNCQGEGPMRQCYPGGNCYTNGVWDEKACVDGETCAENCALEGVNAQQYKSTYGVSAIPGGVELKFVSQGAGGMNVGSRLYLLSKDDKYKMFRLKNREFTFDVDASELPCGLNGAVYFSEMLPDGGMGGGNKAGAKYGTGYCDAQCPHDIKFQGGVANTKNWNSTSALGALGACCTEMDIWEANEYAAAYTPHVCTTKGYQICEGLECGDTVKGQRYEGVCDKDGCDYNSYRMGDRNFLGKGPEFTVDMTKPVTVVTQWITSDGTDDGDLVEIRRLYVQDGKVIHNSDPTILGEDWAGMNSITDEFCAAQKEKFGDTNDFGRKGGLKTMGEALDRGVVLVMSLWDDAVTDMLWLDAAQGKGGRGKPGVVRGPCGEDSGKPADVRAEDAQAYVRYTNIMYGEIGSTYTAGEKAKPENAAADSDAYMAALEQFHGSGMQQPGGGAPQPQPVPATPAQHGFEVIIGSDEFADKQRLHEKLVAAAKRAGVTLDRHMQEYMKVKDALGNVHSMGEETKPPTDDMFPLRLRYQPPAHAQPQPQPQPRPPMVGPSGCSEAYQQCGGKLWTGPTCCEGECECHGDAGGYYSQCMPPGNSYTCSALPPVAGGTGWGNTGDGAFMRKDSTRTTAIVSDTTGSSVPAAFFFAVAAVLMAVVGAVWLRVPAARRQSYDQLEGRVLLVPEAGQQPSADQQDLTQPAA